MEGDGEQRIWFKRSDRDGMVGQVSYDGHEPQEITLDPLTWPVWRKTSPVRAARVPKPFGVETSEGPLTCNDGWIAVDARGYPYPIADDEFVRIYESLPRSSANDAEPLHAEHTVCELLDAAYRRINSGLWETSEDGAVLRELALAKTAIEDARMRFTRAAAKAAGCFAEIDLETDEGQARAAANHLADQALSNPDAFLAAVQQAKGEVPVNVRDFRRPEDGDDWAPAFQRALDAVGPKGGAMSAPDVDIEQNGSAQ